jgi:tryptophan synthase beta chain
VLQDDDGQISGTHSVSAGLDYPAVGPEHAQLHDAGRVEYTSVGDAEAIEAFHLLAETEGILPALESAHAGAEAARHAPHLGAGRTILVNLSGRGDKDVESVADWDAAVAAAAETPPDDGAAEPLPPGRRRFPFAGVARFTGGTR